MSNRPELQNKGKGLSKSPTTGKAQGPGTSHKGISRQIRENKRTEAEERNSNTPEDRTRAFWKARGFSRQSQAARLVTSTVAEINSLAAANHQRSEDWPMVPDLASEPL